MHLTIYYRHLAMQLQSGSMILVTTQSAKVGEAVAGTGCRIKSGMTEVFYQIAGLITTRWAYP
jgi:hypothetical protein